MQAHGKASHMVINIDSGGAPPDDSRWSRSWHRYLYIGGALGILVLGAIWIPAQRAKMDRAEPTASPAPVLLMMGNSFQINAEPSARQASYATTLSNGSDTVVGIKGIGRSGAGLDLDRVEPSSTDLRPHDEVRVVLHYRISDCGAVTNDVWPLLVKVKASGKISTVYVPLRGAGHETSGSTTWPKPCVTRPAEQTL
jgi:hypothetical protein